MEDPKIHVFPSFVENMVIDLQTESISKLYLLFYGIPAKGYIKYWQCNLANTCFFFIFNCMQLIAQIMFDKLSELICKLLIARDIIFEN